MSFSVQKVLEERQGENYSLHDRYINSAFAKVLKIIGFDKVYARGEGAYLYDQQGQAYLDLICGYGVFNMGRSHPVIKAAMQDYLGLDYPNLVKMDAPLLAGLLAEKLVQRTPPSLEKVYFGNSGTEGVETAIKFCRAATGRGKIIFTKGAFHGLTMGALSLNGDPHFRERFGPFLPTCEMIPFNDLAALERALAQGDVAGFVVEPIQGKGLWVGGDSYLADAQRLCRKHGTCLVVDEVQTGMGRTGTFLAFEHWGIEPDLVVLSKSLSGGYVPVSAVLGRKEIFQKVYDRLDRCVVHSTTFSQNGMAMAAGLATLHVLDEERLAENAAKQGTFLKQELEKRKEKFELIKDVRGKGLLLGVEFGNPRSIKLKMAWALLQKVESGLFSQSVIMPLMDKHRILTQVGGHSLDVVKISPALCVTEADLQKFLIAFDEVMAECHRFPGPIWEIGSRLVKHSLKQGGADQAVAAP